MDMKPVVRYETIELLRQLAKKLHQQGDTVDALTLASVIEDVVQATYTPAFYAATFLGSCPCCGACEEMLAVDHKCYGVCHEHRMYWYLGPDHLSLLNDNPERSGQNRRILAPYREVPTVEAFAKNVCPCCGLAIKHEAWCNVTTATCS
jgi:hypothetical protein